MQQYNLSSIWPIGMDGFLITGFEQVLLPMTHCLTPVVIMTQGLNASLLGHCHSDEIFNFCRFDSFRFHIRRFSMRLSLDSKQSEAR